MASSSRQRKLRSGKVKEDKNEDNASKTPTDVKFATILFLLAGSISLAHRWHLSTMFENDRHFSHLSSLERELGFRTEMGLYFSYFKQMITADSAIHGLQSLVVDNITEYPSTINTLKRFNLYPEVVFPFSSYLILDKSATARFKKVFLGCAYRAYQGISHFLGHRTTTCWTVNRGDGLTPVQSCEGLGEPAYFYVEVVFFLNGLMLGLLFLFGAYLSDSLLGGLITVSCFLFNHGECTRVMWTPPLRESFGYPLFVLQMFVLTHIIRSRQTSFMYSAVLASAQILFMLSWQFAQFALLTQLLAVLGTYFLQYISPATFRVILLGQTAGLLCSFVLLFGNEMLLTSLFACCLISAWTTVLLHNYLRNVKNNLLIMLTQGVSFIVTMLTSKLAFGKLLHVEDDAHIGEILRSKFTDFQNFHTMLYTCAKEFDFLETETLWSLLKTLLLPGALVALVAVTRRLLVAELQARASVASSKAESKTSLGPAPMVDTGKPDAEMVYHILQLLAFTAMALIVMRLKLFWTPHLCLFSSLLASPKMFAVKRKGMHVAVLVVVLACMMLQGKANIDKQRAIIGEFSNVPQEELVQWIVGNTAPDAVFAGAMPTMATVKLCTLRPIVNHPHYEDAGLRARTKLVYSLYSRKSLAVVKENLQSLGVHYAILEDSWCTKRSKPGCSMPEIWDVEDVSNQGKVPACQELRTNPHPHFKPVFRNNVYTVLKLL